MPRPDPVNLEVRELLDGVNALPCSYSRRQMLRVLRGLAGRRLYLSRRDLVLPDQLALALRLIGEMSIAEAREALEIRLQVSRAKAYRLIASALQARSGIVPATVPSPAGLRQLALALDDGKD